MRSSKFRTLLLAGCAGLALSPAFARAQSAERTAFNIPAQDLGTALTQFGQQSEREIVFSADLTRNRRARPVTGEMTTAEALTVLLAEDVPVAEAYGRARYFPGTVPISSPYEGRGTPTGTCDFGQARYRTAGIHNQLKSRVALKKIRR